MSYFEFPHTRTYEGDLGYLIKKLEELTTQYNNFFEYNFMRLADPIEWSITSQYAAWSIVFDMDNQAALIAIKPVPAGIAITNTDYWQFVCPLGVDYQARQDIKSILGFIANAYEPTTTATAYRVVGDFLVQGTKLYIVTAPITPGDTYAEGVNISLTTVEEMVKALRPIDNALDISSGNAVSNSAITTKFDAVDYDIAQANSDINDLDNKIDTEINTRSDADTALSGRIDDLTTDLNAEVTTRANADLLLNTRIDNLATLSEGSTTGDAELIDGRVGGNGITYPSIGDAIRGQYDELNDSITFTRNAVSSVYDSDIGLDKRLVNDYWLNAGIQNDGSYLFTDSSFIISLPITEVDNNVTIELNSFAFATGNTKLNVFGFDAVDGSFKVYVNSVDLAGFNPAINIQDYVTQSNFNCSIAWVALRKIVGGVASSVTASEIIDANKKVKVYKTLCPNPVSKTSKLCSYYHESTPFYSKNSNADFIYINGYDSHIHYDATSVTIEFKSLASGNANIYLINPANWKVMKKKTIAATVGINTTTIDVSAIHCDMVVGFYCETAGAFCRQAFLGTGMEPITFPWSSLSAWYASPAGINEGSTVSANYWSGNLTNNKQYTCATIYETRPIPAHRASVIHVDANGGRDFTTINEALRNAGDIGDHATIIIHPGTYNECVYLDSDNCISLIGTDRDSCIIQQSSGRYIDSTVFMAGQGDIENLTINMLVDGSFTPTYAASVLMTYPGYALHLDRNQEDTSKTCVKRVTNCVLYSQAFPALGAGCNQNQKVIIENSELIRYCSDNAFKQNNWQGAFVMHASNDALDTNCRWIMKDCIARSNYGTAGNIRGDLAGQLNFTTTAINNTFYSEETELTDCVTYDQGLSTLSKMSHGNTATNLNA